MRLPVFCITDIPASTANDVLECYEEMLEEYKRGKLVPEDSKVSDHIVFMTTKDIASITEGSSLPVQPFVSPFLGHSVVQVRDWFNANITKPGREQFMQHCFIILDEQSLTDDTCLFVCTQDAPLEALRCDFYLPVKIGCVCEKGRPLQDGVIGCFLRSGTVMTREGLEMAQNGGTYIEDGEIKVDEEWRDFLEW